MCSHVVIIVTMMVGFHATKTRAFVPLYHSFGSPNKSEIRRRHQNEQTSPSRRCQSTITTFCRSKQQYYESLFTTSRSRTTTTWLSAKGSEEEEEDDNDDNDDEPDMKDLGMKSAFDQLELLRSEDLGDAPDVMPESSLFAKQLDRIMEIATLDDDETEEELTPEELNLYTDMFNEISGGEDNVYGNVMGTLAGDEDDEEEEEDDNSSAASQSVPRTAPSDPSISVAISKSSAECEDLIVEEIYEDADGIGASELPEKEDFVEKAVAEALEEARNMELPEGIDAATFAQAIGNQKSIREDEELMKDIDAVFENAEAQLTESIEEIGKKNARDSRARMGRREARIKEDQERLEAAEGSVNSLLGNVSKESRQVAQAMSDLEAAQQTVQADKLMQLADFRNLGVVKQGTVVGALLFFVRAFTELLQAAGDTSHLSAAVLQFGIAGLCVALFFIL
jgi:hypothetical protein